MLIDIGAPGRKSTSFLAFHLKKRQRISSKLKVTKINTEGKGIEEAVGKVAEIIFKNAQKDG